MIVGDGGEWLRRQSMILSQNNHTPIDFWLSLTLMELPLWIHTGNDIVEETKKANETRR